MLLKLLRCLIVAACFLPLGLPTVVRGQQDQEFDDYKVRIDGFWLYSNPSGNFPGAADSGAVDVQGDLGFSTYSTFAGKIDWKFTHKNHFYLAGSPFSQSRQTVLNRQITFQGQTFLAGSTSRASLDSKISTLRATSTTLSAGSAATLESACKSTYLIHRQRSARRLRS